MTTTLAEPGGAAERQPAGYKARRDSSASRRGRDASRAGLRSRPSRDDTESDDRLRAQLRRSAGALAEAERCRDFPGAGRAVDPARIAQARRPDQEIAAPRGRCPGLRPSTVAQGAPSKVEGRSGARARRPALPATESRGLRFRAGVIFPARLTPAVPVCVTRPRVESPKPGAGPGGHAARVSASSRPPPPCGRAGRAPASGSACPGTRTTRAAGSRGTAGTRSGTWSRRW